MFGWLALGVFGFPEIHLGGQKNTRIRKALEKLPFPFRGRRKGTRPRDVPPPNSPTDALPAAQTSCQTRQPDFAVCVVVICFAFVLFYEEKRNKFERYLIFILHSRLCVSFPPPILRHLLAVDRMVTGKGCRKGMAA